MKRMRDHTEPFAPALSDLAFHILLALATAPSHGYAIGKDVEQQSSGRLDPTTGALYQALRRLADDGLIAAGGRARGCRRAAQVLRADRARPARRGRRSGTARRAGAGGAQAQAVSAAGVMMRRLSLAAAAVSGGAAARLRRGDGGDVRAPIGRRARVTGAWWRALCVVARDRRAC